MQQAFSDAGLTALPRDITRRVIGLSLLESMRVLAPREDEIMHRALVDGYKQAFAAMRGRGQISEPLYDGIEPLLYALDHAGWKLGVATGKSDRGLKSCLENHGIIGKFVTLQTADRHPSKPHPAMVYQAIAEAGSSAQNTVMIGDTSFDIQMGRAAGCRTIGVNWGYHSAKELNEAGADKIAESIDELRRHLENML